MPEVKLYQVSPTYQDLFLSNCPVPVSTMNLQVRRYFQQHSDSGISAHASSYQMILRTTTSLNSSPFTVERQRVQTRLSQTEFSLSPEGVSNPVSEI